MHAYLLMPLLIYIPVGIYLFFFFRRFFTLFHLKKHGAAANVLSLVLVVAAARWGWRVYGFGAVVVLHFTVISLVLELLFALLKKWRPSLGKKRWLSVLLESGILVFLIMGLIFGYGYQNIHDVQRTEYTLKTEKALPEDLTIVEVSDLHMGNVMDVEMLTEYCRKLETENPDVLALVGDIFDESTTREEMEGAIKVLSQIQTTYGIFYVFGNHDYNYYTDTPFYTAEELRNELLQNGIQVLEDQTVAVTDFLTIAGRKDLSVGREPLAELLKNVNPDSFVLLLDHQPKRLKENEGGGADLQLSGHTHAGQIWPTGELGALTGTTELNYGLRQMDTYQIIVSSGIAGWGYPIRTGGHSEYVVITVTP